METSKWGSRKRAAAKEVGIPSMIQKESLGFKKNPSMMSTRIIPRPMFFKSRKRRAFRICEVSSKRTRCSPSGSRALRVGKYWFTAREMVRTFWFPRRKTSITAALFPLK